MAPGARAGSVTQGQGTRAAPHPKGARRWQSRLGRSCRRSLSHVRTAPATLRSRSHVPRRTAVCACDRRTHRPNTGCYQRVTTGRTVLLPGCDQRVSAFDNPARHFWRNGTPEGRGRQTRTLEGWERSDSAYSPHARSCSVPGWQLLPCSCGKATAHTSYPLDVSGGEQGGLSGQRGQDKPPLPHAAPSGASAQPIEPRCNFARFVDSGPLLVIHHSGISGDASLFYFMYLQTRV